MAQLDLLGASEPAWEVLTLPDGEARLLHGFIKDPEAALLFRALRDRVAWRQDTIVVYGREHPLPRLQQWYGDEGLTYTWSGISMSPEPWSAELRGLKNRVDVVSKNVFNTVLLNFYRDGKDAVAWHTDDEPELGPEPIIASVSLGAERDFVMRHRHRRDVPDQHIPLPHGSLLLMSGATQKNWLHSLPKRRGVMEARINLTFRRVWPRGRAG